MKKYPGLYDVELTVSSSLYLMTRHTSGTYLSSDIVMDLTHALKRVYVRLLRIN